MLPIYVDPTGVGDDARCLAKRFASRAGFYSADRFMRENSDLSHDSDAPLDLRDREKTIEFLGSRSLTGSGPARSNVTFETLLHSALHDIRFFIINSYDIKSNNMIYYLWKRCKTLHSHTQPRLSAQ